MSLRQVALPVSTTEALLSPTLSYRTSRGHAAVTYLLYANVEFFFVRLRVELTYFGSLSSQGSVYK